MWRLTKMSGIWYAKEFDDLISGTVIDDIEDLIESGDIVTITDDLDFFADEFCINVDDIVVV